MKKKIPTVKNSVNVYTYEDYVVQTDYVMVETPTLIEVMENYTGIPSRMKKVDLLAVPDFDAEGVENWGLNAYR